MAGSTKKLGVTVTAVLAIAVLIGFMSLRRVKDEPKPAAEAAAEKIAGRVTFLMEQQWLIRMMLAQAESKPVAKQIVATGRVIPAAKNRAMVAPPVSGLIAGNQLPQIGHNVKQGQTIAVLRQTTSAYETADIASVNAQLRLENLRLEAERRSLAEKVHGAKASLDEAGRNYERTKQLVADGVETRRRLDEEEARHRVAEANHKAALKELETLNATPGKELEPLPTRTSYPVTAPISGTIVKVHKAMGEQVAAGETIVEIVNLETVWIEAPIFERDLAKIRRQTRAVFATPAHPGAEFNGAIVDIGSVIDPQTKAAAVTFAVPNRDRLLRIGMQADVRLDTGETVEAVVIPSAAILEHEGKKIVYVLLSGEEFERREVKLGDEFSGKATILSGMKAGERVVTQGAYQLKLQELRPAEVGAHTHET